MMTAFTTANLISQIERRSFAPANQSTFSTAEILSIASEELRSAILPEIIKAREEFFVYTKDYSITANQAGYDIPARSYNSIVREIQIVRGSQIIDLPRINPEDRSSTQTGQPSAFYVKNNKIALYPTPANTIDTLRIHYYLTPGDFVETTDAAIISAIDTGTGVVSVSTIPSTWVTGNSFDFLRPDGSQECREVDQVSALVSGTDITFSSLPSDLAVGDYISLAGFSPLVQLPFTMRPVLAQYAAAAILEYAGQSGAKEALEKAMGLLQKATDSLSPRVKGEVEYIQQGWF